MRPWPGPGTVPPLIRRCSKGMPCSYVYLFVIGGEGPGQRSGGRFGYFGSLSPHLDPFWEPFGAHFGYFGSPSPIWSPRGVKVPKVSRFFNFGPRNGAPFESPLGHFFFLRLLDATKEGSGSAFKIRSFLLSI